LTPFKDRLKSRKLIMAILAALSGVLKVYYPDFPDQALYTIVGSLMGYVAIQGVLDCTGQFTSPSDTSGATCEPGVPDSKIINLINQLNNILDQLQQWLIKARQ